jgi:hypothetical protein
MGSRGGFLLALDMFLLHVVLLRRQFCRVRLLYAYPGKWGLAADYPGALTAD